MFFSKKKIGGDIAYHHLEDWWLGTFSEKQREYIVDKYQPMGAPPCCLIEGDITYSSSTPASLLSGLASWFMGNNDRDIGRTIYQKALELSESSDDPLDKHFTLQGLIQIYYRDRDNEGYYDKAIYYCKEQIKMQAEAAAKFKADYPEQLLPMHVGYDQYAIILEKEKRYSETIELSKEADRNGWAGDWKGRIERCEKKAEKLKS